MPGPDAGTAGPCRCLGCRSLTINTPCRGDEFVAGRAEIVEFLRRKWNRELGYALRKDMWAFHGNRIAVRFQYESHDPGSQWFRSYGNELWEFDEDGLMTRREASINDVPISESDRRIYGQRPEAERGKTFPPR